MYVEARGHACSVGSARAVRTRVTTDLFRCFSSDCAKLLILAGQGACACVCVNERARESEREREREAARWSCSMNAGGGRQ